ncbi:hypothetical protein [Halobacteriovorax sp. HLS]|uniref:hypothetical protein n=1 Tax=Halobacteriovorax sp. HLS TaxID=2234000 RepID=UPI000FD7167C|nr:hypothetical protein [Halobacteriovorax sp. HLS]
MFKVILFTVFLTSLLTPKASAAPDDTPDWWNCPNRTSGDWEFGRAPDVCDLDSFIDLGYVEDEFENFIFDEDASRETETHRYMNKVYSLIKDVANYYIEKRNPQASAEEVETFLRASFTIGHQESFWTHYRRSGNGDTQLMRSGGDYGHGHGLFQVDDRWHFPAVLDGRAANIVMNMVYSLEEYFHAWQTAPSTNCATESDYISRARSAYSAYNGGLKRICRWTNPNDRWARNDKGWWSKYQRVEWESYVSDTDSSSGIDIDCIVQGNEGCRTDVGDDPSPVSGKIYKNSTQQFCAFINSSFECVESLRDTSCLAIKGGEDFSRFRGRFSKMPTDFESDYQFNVLDKHELCHSEVSSLFNVGESITLGKNINLRLTPGGAWKVTIPRNSVVQVLDFVLSDIFDQKRFYKVKYKDFVGFIYAGNKQDFTDWSNRTQQKSIDRLIAMRGDKVKVEKEGGVAVYNSDGDIIRELPAGEILTVSSISIAGDMNNIAYQVGSDAFVNAGYSGELLNAPEFFSVIKEVRTPIRTLAQLRKSTWWKRLRVCPSKKCSKSSSIKGPRLSRKKFYVIDSKDNWNLIEQSSKKGWIESKYVRVVK